MILDNPVRAYAWGSPTVIPELLGVPATGEPQAELWMGAHPSAPSTVDVGGHQVPLTELIEKDPEGMLGPECADRFGGRLPYLLKILAVERPLSIQAHPTQAQAARGFAAENAAGIPLDAPNRSYRDRSHKPEMVVALTEFEALLGFRDPRRTAELFDGLAVPQLRAVAARLRDEGTAALESTVRHWLDLPEAEVGTLVGAVTAAAGSEPAHELAELVERLAQWHPGDRGILLALLLEHMHLAVGEAVYVPAGMPHAYLRGVAIEPQASSDNTLRAGLTPKHVDVAELQRILRYEPSFDPAIRPQRGPAGELRYAPGVAEFRLTRVDPTGSGLPIAASGPRIVLVTEGTVELAAGGTSVPMRSGNAAFVPASDGPASLAGRGTAFVVSPDLTAPDQG